MLGALAHLFRRQDAPRISGWVRVDPLMPAFPTVVADGLVAVPARHGHGIATDDDTVGTHRAAPVGLCGVGEGRHKSGDDSTVAARCAGGNWGKVVCEFGLPYMGL